MRQILKQRYNKTIFYINLTKGTNKNDCGPQKRKLICIKRLISKQTSKWFLNYLYINKFRSMNTEIVKPNKFTKKLFRDINSFVL